jgi:magnesium-transporting ATPase (P-type)
LVTVEMFNALNALSENCSLLTLPPWSNPWLLAAICTSLAIHMLILYLPPAARVFTVSPLSAREWAAVLWLSFPVILVDEALKHVSRRLVAPNRARGATLRSMVGLRTNIFHGDNIRKV